MSDSQAATAASVISIGDLHFGPDKDKVQVQVATIDWFDLMQAKVFKYPKGYEVPLHRLSGQILLTVLKGTIEFEDEDGTKEIARAGMFRKCGNKPWITRILEDSYILVIEKTDTETILINK